MRPPPKLFVLQSHLLRAEIDISFILIHILWTDDPVFILRAQDELAASTVEMYRALVASHDSPLVGELQKEIDAFHRWDGPKKTPG